MRHLPLILAALHTLLVLFIAIVVGIEGGEAVILWNLFMIVDFPSSIVFAEPAERLLSAFFRDDKFMFTIGYALIFSVLGGVQYFLLTHWLCSWIGNRSETK